MSEITTRSEPGTVALSLIRKTALDDPLDTLPEKTGSR
ncbi:hypothetical protein RKD23_007818 [Streptomyces sp. SAI-170]